MGPGAVRPIAGGKGAARHRGAGRNSDNQAVVASARVECSRGGGQTESSQITARGSGELAAGCGAGRRRWWRPCGAGFPPGRSAFVLAGRNGEGDPPPSAEPFPRERLSASGYWRRAAMMTRRRLAGVEAGERGSRKRSKEGCGWGGRGVNVSQRQKQGAGSSRPLRHLQRHAKSMGSTAPAPMQGSAARNGGAIGAVSCAYDQRAPAGASGRAACTGIRPGPPRTTSAGGRNDRR